MGRKYNYVSMDRVLSKIYRDLGLEEISETDVVEWAGEALEAIGAIGLYEEAIAFAEVNNHQIDLPNGLHSITQIARNNRWSKEDKDICPANVILDCNQQEMLDSTSSNCGCNDTLEECPVVLDCDGKILGDYEIAYYRPYFDLQYEYDLWGQSHYYKENYTPVRLANHAFFNSIVCQEEDPAYKNQNRVYQNTGTDEYTIAGDKIRFSFKEGSVAIAYHRQKIDEETGYPMVPDDISIISAITYYITWKYMARLWYMGREGYGDKMQESERQWIWYCRQAGNKTMMLYGVDEFQNFTDSRSQMLPTKNRYYGFFGKLGRSQDGSWKDTNGGNFRLRGI